MRAGRARWKIENETFNTLKNQGYCFEHNFGHGKKNLSTVFALMLAFLLNNDVASWQAQMKARRSSYFWEKVRGLFLNYFLKDWETLCVRASGGNSHVLKHRRDQVCRSRFFRGNRIVKAMSAPGRRERGGSRRLALWQRCCLDAPSANVGPLAGIAGWTAPTTRCTATRRTFLPRTLRLLSAVVRRQPCALFAVAALERGGGGGTACIVERSASAGDRRSRRRRLPPRRDAVRRQQCRLLVRPGPQRPSGGARRQAVAQVAPPLRFDRQGLAPVLPLSNPGVVEPRTAGSRKSGAASSRSPLRRDLPELRAGRGADPLRRSPLRAGRTESRNGSLFADQTSTAILPPTHLCFATFASGRGGSKNRPRRRRGRQGPGRNDSDEVPRGCRLHLRAQNSAFVFFDLSLERTVPPGSWRTFGRLRWRSSRPQP